MSELLSADALAAYLGTTRANVYVMRHRGHLPPAVRLGRSLRWRRADVEAWVANQVEAA